MSGRPTILISSRVDVHAEISEARDAVDQRLSQFVWQAGFTPVIAPNLPAAVPDIFNQVRPSGLLLSGGNDLVSLGGGHPERDACEAKLVELFQREGRPIFGICRGLQFLLALDKGKLQSIDGHVRTRHWISSPDGGRLREVNSYHRFAPLNLPPDWEGLAKTEDGCIEWARRGALVQGVMWHPEREEIFEREDLALMRDHFTAGAK